MAEQLGEAVLVLRTADDGFSADMAKAEVGANKLGGTLDKTAASGARMGQGLTVASKEAAAAGSQFQRVSNTVSASAGAQKAGLNQLSLQIGDMATMYALGARPAQIFASQIGQVTGAIQLMTGGTSKLAAFLGGPWGIAVMIAVQVLGPFIGKLWETESAMKAVELAADGMKDAQSTLGEMFDLTTGKIKNQNDMLRLNAQLLAINLRADALAKKASADAAFGDFGKGSMGLSWGQKALGAIGIPVGGAIGREQQVRALLADYRSGKLTPAEAARRAEGLDFSGLSIDKAGFVQAIADQVSAEAKAKTAELIEKSLAEGKLDPAFIDPATPTKPRKARTPKGKTQAEIDAMQADQLGRLNEEELRARLDLTTDATERADIQKELLQLERADRIRAIETNKDLSRAQKDAQIAVIDRLIGKPAKPGPDGTTQVSGPPGLLAQRVNRDLETQQTQLDIDMLARKRAALDAQASIAINLKDRDRLESKALGIQQEIERALLEQDVANGRVAKADEARALLAERQAAQRQQLLNSQKGPLARYQDEIRATAENMGERIEDIEVEGLRRLNDGIADAIMGAKSLGEVFGDVADQIIRDLIRIAVQQMVIAPLAGALFGGDWASGAGGFGGGSNIAAGDNSLLNVIFGGKRALGGPTIGGQAYLVGEEGPEIWVPPGAGTVIPNHALASGGGGGGMFFDLRGAVMTPDLLRQMNAMARREARGAVSAYDGIVGSRVEDHFARRS